MDTAHYESQHFSHNFPINDNFSNYIMLGFTKDKNYVKALTFEHICDKI